MTEYEKQEYILAFAQTQFGDGLPIIIKYLELVYDMAEEEKKNTHNLDKAIKYLKELQENLSDT